MPLYDGDNPINSLHEITGGNIILGEISLNPFTKNKDLYQFIEVHNKYRFVSRNMIDVVQNPDKIDDSEYNN